jgi:holliday junction DNA helicase RuvA
MIASVQGIVARREHDSVVLLVGGVGLDITTSHTASDKCQEGESAMLYTRLIVREDLLALYGFGSETEREMFDTLLKVSGVGPKLAIAILSNMSLDNLRAAIASDKPDMLTRVPGVGKKMAQKIVLELKDKIPTSADGMTFGDFDTTNSDVMDALTSLGFSIIEAQSAVQSLPASAPKDVQERIRLCLQYLSS